MDISYGFPAFFVRKCKCFYSQRIELPPITQINPIFHAATI